ncbi:hypothetical protein [Vibrio diabolicus]|uniref:hypothetical protein n=1 Tax=Vibrio diabolicus TaxID=50719 RepID=UPI00211B081B|nr:hypothetical protein [Vibrio diabolicus]MCG6219266.1 hypothetical protein [Vibrio diabolicus]
MDNTLNQATPEELAALNPNILLYPCGYFGNGNLPEPSLKGYKYRYGKTVVRSKMDLGLSTMRRRCRVAPVQVPIKFQFNGEQKEVFESWLLNELNGGLEWFYLPLLTGDMRLVIHKVQFTLLPGEDSDLVCTGVRPEPGKPYHRISRWELTAEVQAYRFDTLEQYTARVLSRDTLSGLEKAALAAESAVFKMP